MDVGGGGGGNTLTSAGVGQWGWGNLPLVSAIKISACPQLVAKI